MLCSIAVINGILQLGAISSRSNFKLGLILSFHWEERDWLDDKSHNVASFFLTSRMRWLAEQADFNHNHQVIVIKRTSRIHSDSFGIFYLIASGFWSTQRSSRLTNAEHVRKKNAFKRKRMSSKAAPHPTLMGGESFAQFLYWILPKR
jgi:hypothetical protein